MYKCFVLLHRCDTFLNKKSQLLIKYAHCTHLKIARDVDFFVNLNF